MWLIGELIAPNYLRIGRKRLCRSSPHRSTKSARGNGLFIAGRRFVVNHRSPSAYLKRRVTEMLFCAFFIHFGMIILQRHISKRKFKTSRYTTEEEEKGRILYFANPLIKKRGCSL
jgi:hypothetical protein